MLGCWRAGVHVLDRADTVQVEAWKVDKTAMDMVMIRRMFVVPAFEVCAAAWRGGRASGSVCGNRQAPRSLALHRSTLAWQACTISAPPAVP